MAIGTATLEVNLRPLRIGFLVEPTDRRTLSEVARIATCHWGGIAYPLIPVMNALPPAWCRNDLPNPEPVQVTLGLLRFFEPDLLIETRPGQLDRVDPNAAERYERHSNLDYRSFARLEGAMGTMQDVGVTMDHVYAHLHRQEFQFERRTPQSFLKFEGGDDVGQAFFEATYGMFPDRADLAGIDSNRPVEAACLTVADRVKTRA